MMEKEGTAADPATRTPGAGGGRGPRGPLPWRYGVYIYLNPPAQSPPRTNAPTIRCTNDTFLFRNINKKAPGGYPDNGSPESCQPLRLAIF